MPVAAPIPAKRSASRDRENLGASICYDPDKAAPFRDDGGGDPLAKLRISAQLKSLESPLIDATIQVLQIEARLLQSETDGEQSFDSVDGQLSQLARLP